MNIFIIHPLTICLNQTKMFTQFIYNRNDSEESWKNEKKNEKKKHKLDKPTDDDDDHRNNSTHPVNTLKKGNSFFIAFSGFFQVLHVISCTFT